MKKIFVTLVMASAVVLSCSESKKAKLSTQDILHARQVGAPAADVLMSQMSSALQEQLAEDGPILAMQVCNLESGTILEDLRADFPECGVSRRSIKPRVQDNMADADDLKAIQHFTSLADAERLSADFVDESHGRLFYYRPLWTESSCLICHGDPITFSADLAAKLHEAYPKDLAVNFSEGDLQGLLKIEVEK